MFGVTAEQTGAKEPPRYRSSRSKFFSLVPNGLSNSEWTELMDMLRVEQGWSDTKLGKQIGISISMIRQCRIQMRPLPPAARVRILSAMGVEMSLSSLIAALPSAVKEAVAAANGQSSFVRRTLIYGFFDRLDAGEPVDVLEGFFDGLAAIAGIDQEGLADRLGLTLDELTGLRKGQRPIPFLVKMAITESFTAHDMGPLILSLLPTT
jgi:transcriptional regulator with XRE-family HTH domain